MAHDQVLAGRIRDVMLPRGGVTERKMFGGVGWMVNGNMACGVMGDDLVVRLEPEEAEAAFAEPHAGAFGRPGRRPMRGFVLVAPEGIAEDSALARWVESGADFAASLPPK